MTINTNSDFHSQFNNDWATKLIIAIDEAFIEKKEMSERIKNLSTAQHFKLEQKGKDKYDIEFIGRLILTSNNVTNFIKVDDKEIRYWVRELRPIEEDVQFMSKLRSEAPAFLHFLINRELSTTCKTRMWFTPEQIKTDALVRVVKHSRSLLEQELPALILDRMDRYSLNEIKYTTGDLLELLKGSMVRTTQSSISTLLKDQWKLVQVKNATTYESYQDTLEHLGVYTTLKPKGRYYVFTRQFVEGLLGEKVHTSVEEVSHLIEDNTPPY